VHRSSHPYLVRSACMGELLFPASLTKDSQGETNNA
jgi:hypothetical protein